jgi:hypothetical protein
MQTTEVNPPRAAQLRETLDRQRPRKSVMDHIEKLYEAATAVKLGWLLTKSVDQRPRSTTSR